MDAISKGEASGEARRWRILAMGSALAVVAALAFLPTLGNGFLYFDDDSNFFENPFYQGLGQRQIRWAWTTFLLGVYQPLAWMLLELEYVIWGLDPRGYHLTSVILQASCTVAIFGLIVDLLRRGLVAESDRDGSAILVASALATALFAVHPLRVEVVAWASCQPYLPCILFMILSSLAYMRAADPGRSRARWLAASWCLYAAALLSKAVAVSLPVVLLILDVYPLRRLGWDFRRGREIRRALVEKVPFFLLGAAFVAVTLLAKRSNKSLVSVEGYGPSPRVAQACYSVWFYLAKTFWPSDLVAYYPIPRRAELLGTTFALSLTATLGATLVIFLLRRRWPGLPAAWLAYLAILAPNAGLARIGNQIAADRYSYAATIALASVVAYGLYHVLRSRRDRISMVAIGGVGLILIAVLMTISWRQCLTWKTTESLWTRVEQRGVPIATTQFQLGANLARSGRFVEAMARYDRALKLDPRCPDAHNLRGAALERLGHPDVAEAEFEEAVRLAPEYGNAHNNLGAAKARRGDLPAALPHFKEAVRQTPEFAMAHRNLGAALARMGRMREAIDELDEAVILDRRDPIARELQGMTLANVGRPDEAIDALSEAVRLRPKAAYLRTNLAILLEERGRFDEAILRFTEATRIEPAQADAHFLLGKLLARLGRADARAKLDQALRIDPNHEEARRTLDELDRRPPG